MCPLSDPAPCSSPPDVHPFPHRWVSVKPSRNAFCIGHSRAPEAGRWILGWRCHFSPQRRALHRPGNNAHHGEARQDFSGKALPSRPRPEARAPRPHPPGGREMGPPVAPPRSEMAPQVARGRRGEPSRFRRAPVPALALSPRPPGRIPGRRRAEAGPAAGSPLIVRGGGGGGGGGAAEPRQDVAEAVVAVQLGLALGALDGALEAAAEEALRAGRQEGEGEAGLARRRVRDPRGTRALARAAARPRAGAGSASAPAARGPRRPPADRAPTARPAQRGPAHPAPPARPPASQPRRPRPLSRCCHGDAEPSRTGRDRGCPSPPGRGGGGSPRGRGGGAAEGRGPRGALGGRSPLTS